MAKVKRLSLRLLVVVGIAFFLPWFFSLGTYFSGYAHFQDEDHAILINAKSGFYKTIHAYEGQVYRTHIGIYASLGSSMYFFPLQGAYIEGLDPEFAEKVIALELRDYFRGLTYVRLVESDNGAWSGKMQKSESEHLFDKVVLTGRLVGW